MYVDSAGSMVQIVGQICEPSASTCTWFVCPKSPNLGFVVLNNVDFPVHCMYLCTLSSDVIRDQCANVE